MPFLNVFLVVFERKCLSSDLPLSVSSRWISLRNPLETIPRVHLLFVHQIKRSAFKTDIVNHEIQRKYFFSAQFPGFSNFLGTFRKTEMVNYTGKFWLILIEKALHLKLIHVVHVDYTESFLPIVFFEYNLYMLKRLNI